MREIKFRALLRNQHFKGWIYCNILDGLRGIDVDINTICQYTGLKDKNGKEIYEGDIIEFTDKWEWYRSSYGIKMNFAGPSELKELQEKYAAEPMYRREVKFDPLEGYGLSKGDLEDYFEIIGNIYENPELLT